MFFGRLLERIRDRFVRDSITLQIGAAVTAIGNATSGLLLAHILQADGTGQFYVAVSLYSFLWFVVNQGFVQATVTQVAAANSRGLSEKVTGWTAWLLKSSVIFGVLLIVLGFVTLPTVAEVVLKEDRQLGWWAAWLSISPLLETPRVVACAVLQGTRNMLALAQIENAQEAMRVFLVLAGATITRSPEGAVLGTVIASAFGSLIAMEVYRRERKKPGTALPRASAIIAFVPRAPLLFGMRLGFKLGIVRGLNALCLEIVPTLLLARFGTTAWVAYMRNAQRLMRVLSVVMQGISRAALPTFSERAGLKDMDGLRRAYWKASTLSGTIITAGGVLLLPGLWLVLHLLPHDFFDPVWALCLILAPGFVVMSFSSANDAFYIVTDTLKVGVRITVIGAAISVVMLYLLAWWHPTTGVAWGLSLMMACSAIHLFYAAWYFRKHAHEKLPVPEEATVPTVEPSADV
ncbi:MAG: lipopolysaccharide biosynthesis protein [Planctomycetes bacterium]|nr:lipopolysaccharide biosynthesis protein [Planctomycetota bacterium]